jgi:hypothetical protein
MRYTAPDRVSEPSFESYHRLQNYTREEASFKQSQQKSQRNQNNPAVRQTKPDLSRLMNAHFPTRKEEPTMTKPQAVQIVAKKGLGPILRVRRVAGG